MPDIPNFDEWAKGQDPNYGELAKPQVRQFLDKISQSEGADYNTLVGGKKINDLSRHPNVVGLRTSAGPSTAFGRYQITGTTDKSKLAKYQGLDYSPENQDLRAVELLRQTGALDALNAGDEQTAIKRAGREWASIPGSPLPGRKSSAFQQSKQSIPKFDDWVQQTTEQPVAATAFKELNQQPQIQPRTRPKKSILSAATGGMGGQQGIEVGGKVGQPDQATSTRAGLRGLAQMSGAPTQLLPQDTQDWLNETAAQGASQLMTTGAGIARQAGPIGSAPARAVGIKAPFDRNQITRDVANKIQGGAQQIQSDVGAAQAQRGTMSRATQNLVAGSIGSAPAMILTSLGVPPAVAFGLQSELQASGRDADFKDIVKETAKGATIGALFSAPLPVKRELLTTLQAALLKAGIVGAGTAAITGSPQESITNAAFAATGAKEGEAPEGAREPGQTVPEPLQAKLRGAEIGKTIDESIAAKEAKVQPTFLRDDAGNPIARVLNPEEVAAGAKPKIRPIHQADTQVRDEVGKFAVTEAPTEQPNNTVPQTTEPQPSTAVSPQEPLPAASTPSPDKGAATATIPETKPSRLAQGVEQKAIEANLTQGLEGLPEYQTVNVKDQSQKALQLLDSDPDLAKRIATGQEQPPHGLLPESVFTAVENRALQQGDIDTIRDLAMGSRSVEASGMGQRIRMLAERNPASPVKAIADIEKARSAGVPKEKVAQTVNKIKTEVDVEMKKAAPKVKDWASFLESIKC